MAKAWRINKDRVEVSGSESPRPATDAEQIMILLQQILDQLKKLNGTF